MAIYVSDAQLYTCFASLFGLIERDDPTAATSLLKASLAIRFNCVNPTAAITLDARKAPVQIYYGSTTIKPTVDVGLKADTLHCLLLGSLRLRKAIGNNMLELKGPVWKTMVLSDLFHHAQRFYPQVLQDHGLSQNCPGSPA